MAQDAEHVLGAIEAHCGQNQDFGKTGGVMVIGDLSLTPKQAETVKDAAYASELVPMMK